MGGSLQRLGHRRERNSCFARRCLAQNRLRHPPAASTPMVHRVHTLLIFRRFLLPPCKVLDTKDLVLKTLVAHLQIRGLARERTSYFETADVQLLDDGHALLEDGSEEAIGDLPRE